MLGALIGAGSRLLGGYLNQKNASRNIAMQREFATTGIQRRAEDAAKAGISKLYALGANTQSFSPVAVGGLGSGIAEAGQDIGRAIDATANPAARGGKLATELATAQIEGVRLDNQIKQAELLSKSNLASQPGQPPAILDDETVSMVPGQGNAAIKLQKRIAPAGYTPQKSFGVSPEIDMYRTKYGFSPEVPSELGEAQESQPLAAAQWFIRNKIMPGISEAYKTFPYPPPDGSYWQFNPVLGEYTLRKGRQPSWEAVMEKLRR